MTTPFFYTYNAIFETEITSNAKLVYAYICKCTNDYGQCFPTHKTIANACSLSISTVKKAIDELSSSDLLNSKGQIGNDGNRRANLYTIIKEKVTGFFSTVASIFDKAVTSKAKIVYLYLSRLSSGKNEAFPSHNATASACQLSISSVRKALDELETVGFLTRQNQFRDNGGQKSNIYFLETPSSNNNINKIDDESAKNDKVDKEQKGIDVDNLNANVDNLIINVSNSEIIVNNSIDNVDNSKHEKIEPKINSGILSIYNKVCEKLSKLTNLNSPHSRQKTAPHVLRKLTELNI